MPYCFCWYGGLLSLRVQMTAQPIIIPFHWTADGKRTQFAYRPGGAILKTVDLSNPKDLFWHEDCLYIADTGNKRIVVYDLQENTHTAFGEGVLEKPEGIFVRKDGAVYVADAQAEAVFLFDKDRNLIQTIGRPESPPFRLREPFCAEKCRFVKRG